MLNVISTGVENLKRIWSFIWERSGDRKLKCPQRQRNTVTICWRSVRRTQHYSLGEFVFRSIIRSCQGHLHTTCKRGQRLKCRQLRRSIVIIYWKSARRIRHYSLGELIFRSIIRSCEGHLHTTCERNGDRRSICHPRRRNIVITFWRSVRRIQHCWLGELIFRSIIRSCEGHLHTTCKRNGGLRSRCCWRLRYIVIICWFGESDVQMANQN